MPEAMPVFDDLHAITITDDESDPNEQRFVTLGIGAMSRLLVVVYTWRGENIRIISGLAHRAKAPLCAIDNVPQNLTSMSSTRQNDERPIRLQQRQARPGHAGGT